MRGVGVVLPPVTSTSFNANQSGLTYGGPWLVSGGDKYTWGQGGGNNGLDFYATGTKLELQLYCSVANCWAVTVDGVTTTPTLTTGSYQTVTAFDGSHRRRRVQLRNTASGRVKVSGFGVLYGQPPSITYGPNLGPDYPVKDTTNSGDNRGFLKDDGSLRVASVAGGYTSFPLLDCGTAGYTRFKATTAAISLWMYRHLTDSQAVRLCVDGVMQASALSPSQTAGTWGWVTWTGLDAGAEHEYRIVYDTHEPTVYYPWQVAASGTMNTGALAAPTKAACFYGDSITSGTGVGGASLGYAFQTMLAKGYGGRTAALDFRTIRNISGTGAGGSKSGEADVTRSITNYGTAWDEIVVLLGANDAGAVYGAFNQASTQTAYGTMLTAIRAACAGSNIRCLGMLNTTAATYTTNRTACNTAISDAVTAFADANCTYHSTDGWIDPATDTDDGLHPNTAGVAKIVTALSAII